MILRRLFGGSGSERLTGVVISSAAVSFPAEEGAVRFRLCPWRRGGGEPELRPLWVRGDVSAFPGGWEKELAAGRAIALEVVRDSWRSPRGAELVRIIGDAAGDEPLREADAWLRSAAIEDIRFGRFAYFPTHEWYEGKAHWSGRQVEIVLMNDDGAVQQSLASAHRLWNEMDAVDSELLRRIVAELLPLKNEAWLAEDEAPLAESDFLSRIALEAIHVHADGLTQFYYEDGDLFFGHTIIVGREGDGEISEVQIAG